MRTYVVDDSRLARNELIRLCESIEMIEIVGQASNADDALAEIPKCTPDLLLLDIQMPEMDGFELLERLDSVPQVIFVTAYNEYAVRAFEVNALDYLTKPVNATRLSRAVSKAAANMDEIVSHSTETKEALTGDDRVFVKDGERCWFVPVGDIFLLESEGNYTKIHFDDERPLIHKTLTYLENRLDATHFFRANRSQIINLKRIKTVDPWFGNRLKVTLFEGPEVEISRRQTQEFRELMSF